MLFRLLLITDDLPVRQAVRSLAPALGAEISVADALEPAQRSIRDEHFHGIVIDASLRGLSREQFVWFIRKSKLNAPTPLYIVAGSSGPVGTKGAGAEGVWWVARAPGLPELRGLLFELRRRTAVERRKSRRLPFQTSLNAVHGVRRFPARSLDLSVTGMQLETSFHLERGEEFDVHFQMEEGAPPLRVHARVARMAGPNRFGISFENLNADYRRRLTQFLDRHLAGTK